MLSPPAKLSRFQHSQLVRSNGHRVRLQTQKHLLHLGIREILGIAVDLESLRRHHSAHLAVPSLRYFAPRCKNMLHLCLDLLIQPNCLEDLHWAMLSSQFRYLHPGLGDQSRLQHEHNHQVLPFQLAGSRQSSRYCYQWLSPVQIAMEADSES